MLKRRGMRSSLAVLAFLIPTSAVAAGASPTSCITVKALGCYVKVPSDVLLIADSPGDGTLLSLGMKGTFHFVPRSSDRQENLTEKSRVRRGHLEIIEYYQPGDREPGLVTVIHSGEQQLELTGEAQDYSSLVVDSCLANVRPVMRIFRSLSSCSLEAESKVPSE
jgi:hypothetical protein